MVPHYSSRSAILVYLRECVNAVLKFSLQRALDHQNKNTYTFCHLGEIEQKTVDEN